MSMTKRMRDERYRFWTSAHPHMLSKVEIPWQQIRCLLMFTQTSQDASLMTINTTCTENAHRMTNIFNKGSFNLKINTTCMNSLI